MSADKLLLTPFPRCRLRSLYKFEVLVLTFLPMPAYADSDDTLLQFSMQVGSIMYASIITFLLFKNARARTIILGLYFFLTVSAYLFAFSPASQFSTLITIFICSITPLFSTIVLGLLIRLWRKT